MDIYNVPKKVNRHVLKALNVLSDARCKDNIGIASIIHQLKYQMRNLVPVRNLASEVQKSLYNMSAIGLIECHGPDLNAIGHSYTQDKGPQQPPANCNNPPAGPNPQQPPANCDNPPAAPNRRLFQGHAKRKRTRSSRAAKMQRDRKRKGMRTSNKPIRHATPPNCHTPASKIAQKQPPAAAGTTGAATAARR